MKRNFIFYTVATACILLSAITWSMEIIIGGLCPYCLTERAVVGILGIIMLLSPKLKFFRLYLGITFGFYGAYVASRQIFLDQQAHTIGLATILAILALFIIIGEVLTIIKS